MNQSDKFDKDAQDSGLFLSRGRSFSPPPFLQVVILGAYLALSVALAILMSMSGIATLGLLGAIVINLLVLFFARSEVALPLYLLVAGPSVALSLGNSGLLSRLYIGNLLFFLVMAIWIIFKVLPQRRSSERIIAPSLLTPLLCLIGAGVLSILCSHLFADPQVSYVFPHSNTPLIVTNAAELMLLVGLPMFLIVVPGVIRTVRHVHWTLLAYTLVGLMYALGTIFSGPLGLTSQEAILGVRRPQVFGSISSGLGTLIVLFASIAFGQALYARTRQRRLLWSLLTLIFCAGVIMTFGRESWIGLGLSLLTIVALYTKSWKMLMVIVIVSLPILLLSGLTTFFDPSKAYGSDRFIIWQDAITIWLHSPLVGVGAGNFQFFDLVYAKDVVGIAHNQYLQVLAEMGIPGLVALIWLLSMVGRICIQRFRTARTELGKAISIAYLGYFVSMLFGGLFTSSFIPSAASGGGTAAFVEVSYRWLLLGLVLSIPTWEPEALQLESPTPVEATKADPLSEEPNLLKQL